MKKDTYNMWRRDRRSKGGGGVMTLVNKDILIEKVEYGRGMAEMLSAEIKIREEESRKVTVVHIPLKTSSWEAGVYRHMQNEAIKYR